MWNSMVTKETYGKISMEIRSFDIPKRKGMGEREASKDMDLMRKSIIREFFFYLRERKTRNPNQCISLLSDSSLQHGLLKLTIAYISNGEALQLTPAIKFLLTKDERQLPQSCFDLDLKTSFVIFRSIERSDFEKRKARHRHERSPWPYRDKTKLRNLKSTFTKPHVL